MVLDILSEAWISIRSHKLRMFLTTLGIVVGVYSVIIMVGIGKSVNDFVLTKLEVMGSDLIYIWPGASSRDGIRSDIGTEQNLTMLDARVVATLPGINDTAPSIRTSLRAVESGNNWKFNLFGSTPNFIEIYDREIVMGRAFTENDIQLGKNIIILGQTVVRELFDGQNPIGETIRLNKVPFQVIGVLKAQGESIAGTDLDNIGVAPITTVRQKIISSPFRDSIHFIIVSVQDVDTLPLVKDSIRERLRELHRIQIHQEDDFVIRDLATVIDSIKDISEVMSVLLIVIASLSLFVGSIGIMNMMLISVIERTHEIGIRKVVGATNRSIIMQFLIEAELISLVGCLVGAVMGILTVPIVQTIMGLEISMVLWPLWLSLGISITIGTIAGIYPAMKAAKLTPAESLYHI